jgi:hypothetical protein
MSEFDVGDRVVCNSPGSWVHDKQGTVQAVDVLSPDNIRGYQLRIEGHGITVVPPAEVSAVPDVAAAHRAAAEKITQAADLIRQAAITLSGTAWSGELSNEASDLHDLSRRVANYDHTSD